MDEKPIGRPELLNDFAWLKDITRLRMEAIRMFEHDANCHRRARAKLETEKNIFNRFRIAKEKDALERARFGMDILRRELASYGDLLMAMCQAADELLSDHDKAQVLGTNHIRMKRETAGETEAPSLFELIFARHLEYRGNDDFLPSYTVEMPLWNIASEHFFRQIRKPEYAGVIAKGFDEFFPGVPQYRQVGKADGTVGFERIPPRLKVVEGGNGGQG